MAEKKRLDHLLADRYAHYSRHKLQQLIKQGCVAVNDVVVTKPGVLIDPCVSIIVNDDLLRYVSRAGLKLEAALDAFTVNVVDAVVVDVGLSTGGFTDCLLQHGAKRVYGVDVGTGQVHPRISQDPRVIVYEKTDIRDFIPPEKVDLVVVDISFISLVTVLAFFKPLLRDNGQMIVLVKPQFEVGKEIASGAYGVIKDRIIHQQVMQKVRSAFQAHGFIEKGFLPSPVLGSEGNQEFLLWVALSADNG